MLENEKTLALLEEIRDSQRQLLDEYRRVANESVSLQKQAFQLQQGAVAQQKIAVDTQAYFLRMYRRVLIVAVPLIVYVIWVVVRHS